MATGALEHGSWRSYGVGSVTFVSSFFLVINKRRITRSPCSLCVSLQSTLNAWNNLYEIWYVRHGTWTHLNGILHKSFLSVCVCLCISLSLLSNDSVKTVWGIIGPLAFYAVRVVSNGSRRLGFPTIWCFLRFYFILTSKEWNTIVPRVVLILKQHKTRNLELTCCCMFRSIW
jgi:hypothetical protein